MSEWWTYRPSDFLMFAPRIYWRLFESINAASGPAWLLAIPLALALGAWARPGRSVLALRLALAATAAAWAWVGWAFLWQRFAPIQWVAEGYAWAFAVQALGLLLVALAPGLAVVPAGGRRRVALGLGLWALLAQPALAGLSGRPWLQAELWGLAPDPTVIGTLAVLLLLRAERPAAGLALRTLWALPLAWCAISAATLATMDEPQAVVPLAAAVLAAGAARFSRA